MAAAIWSMLGKSGKRISSLANMVAMRTLNLGYFSRHPIESYFPAVYHPRNIRSPKLESISPELPERLYGSGCFLRSSRYNVRVMSNTHFALEEFNKQKNHQLQFVKLVKAYNQWTDSGTWQCHLLTLEAIDADNVVKTYLAIVAEPFPSKPPDPQLLLFGLVADNGVQRENIKLQRSLNCSRAAHARLILVSY